MNRTNASVYKIIPDALINIAASGGGGATPQQVWEYATRTLTQSATEVVAAVTGSSITQVRGNTWNFTLPNISLGGDKIQFVLKRSTGSSDDNAILFIDSDNDLIRINGREPAEGELATLIYDSQAETLTIYVEAPVTAQLLSETIVYGIQSIDTTTGEVREPYGDTFVIIPDAVRATE
jgi:hypothetical protein